MQRFGLSMLPFWGCCLLVTLVGVLHTVFNICVLKMTPMDAHSMGEGYERTKPWITLIYLAIFLGPSAGFFLRAAF